MQMTPEARAWLDAAVRRILARHPLGDAERAGITYELMSHLHAGGEVRAKAAGRAEVAREDLEAALAQAGGEEGLARAFVQPLARPVEAAPLGRRLGAGAVDAFLLALGLVSLHGLLEILLRAYGGTHAVPAATFAPNYFLPWGFHDPTLPLAQQVVFHVASAGLILGYFAWFEGHEGRSLGKRAMDLRVVRLDGRPMTYREALLRNLVKLSPPVLLLDLVVMLVAFPKERQRVSDKIAQTLVVRA